MSTVNRCEKCGDTEGPFFTSRQCKVCKAEVRRKYRLRNKDVLRLKKAEYYQKNIEARKAYDRAYNERNKESRAQKGRDYYKANRDKCQSRHKAYRKANPGKIQALNREYESRKKDQRCTCCTEAELQQWYIDRPNGHHVDHKHPLSLGGLHCTNNLQYLSAKDNLSKGNRWIDE